MVDLMSDKIEKADDPDTLALVGALTSDKTKSGEGFPPEFAANTSGSTQKGHTMSEEKRTRTRIRWPALSDCSLSERASGFVRPRWVYIGDLTPVTKDQTALVQTAKAKPLS